MLRGSAASLQLSAVSLQLYPTSLQLYPTSLQLYPTSLQLYPASLQLYPASLRAYAASLQVYAASLQLYPASLQVYPASLHGPGSFTPSPLPFSPLNLFPYFPGSPLSPFPCGLRGQSCYHARLVYHLSEMSLAVKPEQTEGSDVELLHAVARGDEAALARLYDSYRVILFGLLVRILNSREEAEDILQDVFIQVWRRAKDFDEQRGRPFTWLVTLARSRAIDRLRLLGARQRLAASAERERVDEVSDALTDAIKGTQQEVVRRALAELPEEQKTTLVLAYFEGLTQSEIAAKLGAPLGTVKTRMRSGMIKLRALLEPQLENFG